MTSLPDADRTRLTAVPAQPPDTGDDRMNAFEVAVNFVLDELPGWALAVLGLVVLAAGAIEMFIEAGPWWSVLIMAGLIGSGVYGGSRLRRLPLVPVVVKKRGSRA